MNAKPKIGIDIDDVLGDGMQALVNFHNENYGTQYETKDITHAGDAYKPWGGTKEVAIERFERYYHSLHFENIEPFSDAKKVLEDLKKDFLIIAVTSRTKKITKEKTINWINLHFPNIFSEIYFADHHMTKSKVKKSDVCKELGIKIMIEDFLFHAKDLAENGIKVFLLDKPRNQAETLPQNVTRVFD